jgi:hypothetical protein
MDMRNLLRAQWDRVLAAVAVVGGLIALLIGWIGISGTSLSYKQLPYIISGGLFGVVLIGIGMTVYLSADLRDEWRKLDSLEDTLREAIDRLAEDDHEAETPEVSRSSRTARAPRRQPSRAAT